MEPAILLVSTETGNEVHSNVTSHNDSMVAGGYYMGQCPAKSGLWGYNFITIKIARCTKQHIFATVLPFPFKFRALVLTPFLCVKIDFYDLLIFRKCACSLLNCISVTDDSETNEQNKSIATGLLYAHSEFDAFSTLVRGEMWISNPRG